MNARERFLGAALILSLSTIAAVDAQPLGSSGRLLVGTKEAVPFAIRSEEGQWSGISIDLWTEVAQQLDLEFELQEESLEGLVEGVEQKRLDVAVAALTITAEREARVDFTHPFYTTGLGIAVLQGRGGWIGFAQRLFSKQFLAIVGSLALLLLAVGAAVWLVERKRNAPQFGGGAVQGLGSGFWWSAVTMTTVGYGDKAPVTPAGRLIALVWMFASLIAISTFTAAIASSLTLNQLESVVRGPEDLPGVIVGSVPGSTSARYLESRGIETRYFSNPSAALAGLAVREVQAVVYDAPILQYGIRQRFASRLQLLPHTIQRQDYGIALPQGSELREPINRVLLETLRTPAWQEIQQRYLGE